MKKFSVEIIKIKTYKVMVEIEANDTIEAKDNALRYSNETELSYRVPFYLDIEYKCINMPYEINRFGLPIKS